MEEVLVLTNSKNKKGYLEANSKQLFVRKVMTFEELKNKKYYSYDERAIYDLMKEEKISYSIAQLFLKNMIGLRDLKEEKVQSLKRMEHSLEEKGILLKSPLFSSFMMRQKIFIYGQETLSKEEKSLLEGFSYEFIKTPEYRSKKPLYIAETEEEEVYFLAQEISSLLKEGVAPSKIKIINLDDEYRMLIDKIFPWYHIPTSIGIQKSIYGTKMVQELLKKPLEEMETYLDTVEESEIKELIKSVLNTYFSLPKDDITKEMIREKLKRSFLSAKEEGVEEGDIHTLYAEDTRIFIVGFNQGSLPILHREEDYFNDALKEKLGLTTSILKNQEEKEVLTYFLNHHSHILLSYKKKSLSDTFYPSSFLEEIEVEKYPIRRTYQDSHFANRFLLGKLLDNYYQYNIHSDMLEPLYASYSDLPYGEYQNQYQKISPEQIKQALQDKLLLSYSSLDTYYRCSFRYYVEKVLKLNQFEDTFLQKLGTLYHYVLSKAFEDGFDFEKEWNFSLEENHLGVTKKETFFLKKLKKELQFIIEEIKNQYRFMSLKKAFYEEKIYTHPTGEDNITFMGIIDKLLYEEDNNIVAVIDYKTGNPNLELRNIPYGLEMQLPIYLYLVHHFSKIQNPKIAGFYLQKILHNEIIKDSKKTYEEMKRENLRLQGYSTSDTEVLERLDSMYQDSALIKSMKTTSKGFSPYSKVLSPKEMDSMLEMVEEKIKAAIASILEGDFSINPKRIGFDNVGCEFCAYHDICYHVEKDIVNLKKIENLDFLGGDENA